MAKRMKFLIAALGLALTFFVAGCRLPNGSKHQTSMAISSPFATAEPDPLDGGATSTETALPPTATPIPTETPLPRALTIPLQALTGMKIRLRHGLRDHQKSELEFLIQRFNQENEFGVAVEAEYDLSDERLGVTLLTAEEGAAPDMIIAESAYFPLWRSQGIDFFDLQRFIQASEAPNGGINGNQAPRLDSYANLIPEMLAQEWTDISLFRLPLWHSPTLLFYNKTWAKELGFPDEIQTMNDFKLQTCAAFSANFSDAKDAKKGTGGWLIRSSNAAATSWLLNFAPVGADISALLMDEQAESFSEMAQFLRSLSEQGCAWNGRLSENYGYFADRYALLYAGTFANIDAQQYAFSQLTSGAPDEWGLIPFPRKSAQGILRDPVIFSTATSIGITASMAEKQLASWIFITWLMKAENLVDLAIEAKAWPVIESESTDDIYRKSAGKLMADTLPWRHFVNAFPLSESWKTDGAVLSDGFDHIFSLSENSASINGIWEQIKQTVKEVHQLKGNEK